MRRPTSLKLWIVSILSLGFSLPFLFANELPQVIAWVSFVKGEAYWSHSEEGPFHPLLARQPISQGQFVKTKKSSILKIKLLDQTQVVLGPNSKSKINFVKEKSVGVVGLVSGQLRSIVKKENKKDKRSKFIIMTKSAAMGVRGTDFQVSSKNLETNLYVGKGNVAFVPYSLDEIPSYHTDEDIQIVDKELYSHRSVEVKKGQYSQIFDGKIKVFPTTISNKKLNTWSVEEKRILSISDNIPHYRNPMIKLVKGLRSNSNTETLGVRERGEKDVEKYRRHIREWREEME